MAVDSTHPEYRAALERWTLVRDVVHNKAKGYIRTVDVNDPARSAQYRDDAILTNFTRLTKEGLTGLIFRKPETVDLPEEMDYMYDDATGSGLNLHQLAKFISSEVQQTGRIGLLVDHPTRVEMGSIVDDELTQMKPRIKPYAAESIINWATTTVGSKTVLSMVVLKECVEYMVDFVWVQEEQYRVLYLNENFEYQQDLYNSESEVIVQGVPVLDADGRAFNHIPFYFIGSDNNDSAIDHIPLYDLSVVNLGHYRNSADYEETIFICGQPTYLFSGDIDVKDFENMYGSELKIGARAAYFMGNGGGGQVLQSAANQLPDQAMRRKEEQMVQIGARIITPSGGRETAEAARIRYGSQNSALSTFTSNMSLGILAALRDVARFLGLKDVPLQFELNKQFYEDSADPQLIAQQIMLFDRNIIDDVSIRDYLRRTNAMRDDRTDEDIEAELETNIDPLAGVVLDGDDE
jgi:hypothetical protein